MVAFVIYDYLPNGLLVSSHSSTNPPNVPYSSVENAALQTRHIDRNWDRGRPDLVCHVKWESLHLIHTFWQLSLSCLYLQSLELPCLNSDPHRATLMRRRAYLFPSGKLQSFFCPCHLLSCAIYRLPFPPDPQLCVACRRWKYAKTVWALKSVQVYIMIGAITKRVFFFATFLIGLVLVLIGVVIITVIFPAEIDKQVDEGMNIWDNKSEGYRLFVSSKFRRNMQNKPWTAFMGWKVQLKT